MLTRQSALKVLGVVALGSLLGAPVYGTTSLHTNYLTFGGAVALPGVSLPAGTYIFEQVDITTPDVVVVRSRDRRAVHFMAFTNRVDRPRDLRPDRMVTFGEAERGAPARITAWYPVNSSRGYEFMYSR